MRRDRTHVVAVIWHQLSPMRTAPSECLVPGGSPQDISPVKNRKFTGAPFSARVVRCARAAGACARATSGEGQDQEHVRPDGGPAPPTFPVLVPNLQRQRPIARGRRIVCQGSDGPSGFEHGEDLAEHNKNSFVCQAWCRRKLALGKYRLQAPGREAPGAAVCRRAIPRWPRNEPGGGISRWTRSRPLIRCASR
jgi:hypothetical protein